MARLRSHALRTEPMVSSHLVRVLAGPSVRSVHGARFRGGVSDHVRRLSDVRVPVVGPREVQIAQASRLFRTLGSAAYVSLKWSLLVEEPGLRGSI